MKQKIVNWLTMFRPTLSIDPIWPAKSSPDSGGKMTVMSSIWSTAGTITALSRNYVYRSIQSLCQAILPQSSVVWRRKKIRVSNIEHNSMLKDDYSIALKETKRERVKALYRKCPCHSNLKILRIL